MPCRLRLLNRIADKGLNEAEPRIAVRFQAEPGNECF